MSEHVYLSTASAVFAVVAIVHGVRAIAGWELMIAGVAIPVWVSWIVVFVLGFLAVRGWMFARASA